MSIGGIASRKPASASSSTDASIAFRRGLNASYSAASESTHVVRSALGSASAWSTSRFSVRSDAVPVAAHGAIGDAERRRRFHLGHAGEEAHLDHLRRSSVDFRE